MDISPFPEFDGHETVTYMYDRNTGLRGFVAIHRNKTGRPSLGATRLWNYKNETDALRDALRLSRLMSYKSALAGLNYGGAKATLVAGPAALVHRNAFFKSYAKNLNNLCGRFITGTDVGVTDNDVKFMRRHTPYVIGVKVDPAFYTALGVYSGIQASLHSVFGSEDASGRTFAIQGVGKVGSKTLGFIYKKAKAIFVADIHPERLKAAKKLFPRVTVVAPELIHKQHVDVFVPCALGGVISATNVDAFDCSIIAGSANNQLQSAAMGEKIHRKGILYAPDYVINAGGIISVADEMEHQSPSTSRISKKVLGIKKTLARVFSQSKQTNRSPNRIADEMAEKILRKRFK
jgi:leucine dehydrogenase